MEKAPVTSNLIEFWETVVEVWQHGFMGVDIGNIIVAVLILGFFLLLRGIFSKFILGRLGSYAERTTSKLDDKIFKALAPPVRFVPVILGIFFAGKYLGLSGDLEIFFDRVIRSLIAYTIFWGLHRAVEPVSEGSSKLKKLLSPMMARWIFRALRLLVVFIGAAVILEMWGIKVGPLLAGLGLFGAAIALGAQDLFKNLIGGITIIAEKRFAPGDWIMVEGVVEGTVEDIGFRSTKLRRFDKAPVHVPNAQLSDAVVTNFTRMSHRRIKWLIGVEYRTTVDQLKMIRDGIMDYIQKTDAFAKEEGLATFVRVDSFNSSSIDILVYCFTKSTVWGEWLEAKEKLAIEIKNIVEKKAKTGFAFPSQSVYLETWPGDTAEVFIPPKDKKAA